MGLMPETEATDGLGQPPELPWQFATSSQRAI
jgi:hypothetical protein